MQNLRDKLLQAGLVTKEQTTQAEVDSSKKKDTQRAQNTSRPNGGRPATQNGRPPSQGAAPNGRPLPHAAAANGHRGGARPQGQRAQASEPEEKRIPRLPPLALPGSKAYQRLESLKQLELDKKLRALVHENQVPVDVGATVFYFMTRKNRLRRLELTEPQAKLLEEGALAVVERPEPGSIEHSLVPRATAERMLSLSPKAVRFWNREGAPVGFMDDDELKSRQEDEASAAPETPESETERADEAGAEAAANASEAELDAAQAELDAHQARKGES